MNITEDHIINKFREIVSKRYQYEDLSKRFQLPEVINPEVIADVENYFLNYIYPPAAERRELEAAFESLKHYVSSPRKIWGLLGNMTKAVFKFGRQFPAALRAGMAGLEAFLGAKHFEETMAKAGTQMQISPPMTDEDYERTMATIPQQEIENFIHDVEKLLRIMANTNLTGKTIEILDDVITTMRNKPNVYPEKDVLGIMLGKDILENGYLLFSKFDEGSRKVIIDYIMENELWYKDYVYNKWKDRL